MLCFSFIVVILLPNTKKQFEAASFNNKIFLYSILFGAFFTLCPFFIFEIRLTPGFIITRLCLCKWGNLKELRKNGGLGQRITLKKLDIGPHFYVILLRFPRMLGANANDYENKGKYNFILKLVVKVKKALLLGSCFYGAGNH